MPLTKRTRFEVLRRDGYRCRYCGATAPEGATLTVDHVTPVALGGTDAPSNLVAACRDCNAGKSSTAPAAPLVEQVAEDAIRWARAMAAAAAELDSAQHLEAVEAVDKEWRQWTSRAGGEVARPGNWKRSIRAFVEAGLPIDEMVELVETAMDSKARDTWRYFCGCCWTRIRQMQDRARAILDAKTPSEPLECDCDVDPETPHAHGSERDCDIFQEGAASGWRRTWPRQVPTRLLERVIDKGYEGLVDEERRLGWGDRLLWIRDEVA